VVAQLRLIFLRQCAVIGLRLDHCAIMPKTIELNYLQKPFRTMLPNHKTLPQKHSSPLPVPRQRVEIAADRVLHEGITIKGEMEQVTGIATSVYI